MNRRKAKPGWIDQWQLHDEDDESFVAVFLTLMLILVVPFLYIVAFGPAPR